MRDTTLDASTLVATVRAAFVETYGRPPAVVVRAPGRVNLLGAHVDYSEGHVMPCAIDRAVYLAAAPRTDTLWQLDAPDLPARATLDTQALPPPVPARAGAGASWHDYAAGVAHALAGAGLPLLGLDVSFSSDVPIGAGLSSSAALEMALVLAWHELALAADALDAPLASCDRALIGQHAENDYLGVRSGIMDPFASVHGTADRVVLLDCRTLEYELLPLRPDVALLVIDSGLRRRLVDSAFNDRRAECERAVDGLRPHLPDITTLRDVSPDDLRRHGACLPETERRRARHVVEECARVRRGADALRRGDVPAFGAAIRESHASMAEHYDVSLPELDTLARAAWSVPGCHGARLTGAGFGGCVTALVDRGAVDAVVEHVTQEYAAAHGRQAVMHVCRAVQGAHVVPD